MTEAARPFTEQQRSSQYSTRELLHAVIERTQKSVKDIGGLFDAQLDSEVQAAAVYHFIQARKELERALENL